MFWACSTAASLPRERCASITYLLSARADGITGQLIRFTGDQLHIMRQPGFKDPVLRRDSWTTEDIAVTFDDILDHHLEPFGLRSRRHPGCG
jgi:hypothetical protein